MVAVCRVRLLLVTLSAVWIQGLSPGLQGFTQHEPTCTSRYDYEHHVVHAIVNMEMEQEALTEQIGTIIKNTETEKAKYQGEITELQKSVDNKNDEINDLTKRIEKLSEDVAKGCSQQCKDDRALAGYTYKDELAQATCVAIGVRYVYAVRRQCASSAPDCASICKSLGTTCINSLHVYSRPTLQLSDIGKAGLYMYRYNNCQGGCGPNFCCCQSNSKVSV